jgi:hypothetical protein
MTETPIASHAPSAFWQGSRHEPSRVGRNPMTDFELSYLFNEHVETMVTMLFGYFSITSAFLVATYLTAHTLARFIAWVVIALYSVTSLALFIISYKYVQMVVGIRDAMRDHMMSWHPGVTEHPLILPLTFYSIAFGLLAIFVASLWFFYIARFSGEVGAPGVEVKQA